MRGYANTKYGQLHYRREGTEGPVLVMYHESPLSSAIYEPVLPLIGKRAQMYAFDFPGYGMSDAPAGPIAVPEMAKWCLEAVNALGIDKFAVGGCHTGASIAVEVARLAGADRITHCVLTGVPLLTPEEQQWWLNNWIPEVELGENGEHLMWAWKRYLTIWDPKSDVRLVHMAVMQILTVYDRYTWGYKAAFTYDPGPALRSLKCPTLLINAENDHMTKTDEPALKLLANGKLVKLPGLPGQLPWRATERFAREVADFITKASVPVGATA